MARRAVVLVAVAAVVALVLLTRPSALTRLDPRPIAEVVSADDAGCLTADVVAALGGWAPEGTLRLSSRAGTLPPGFEPVRVVECRLERVAVPSEPRMVPSPDLHGRAAGDTPEREATGGAADSEAAGGAPEGGAAAVRVTEVTLEGDLGPLVGALGRPSHPDPYRGACPAIGHVYPQILLVDAAGNVVRPQWPVKACGYLDDGALPALERLEEVGSVVLSAEIG